MTKRKEDMGKKAGYKKTIADFGKYKVSLKKRKIGKEEERKIAFGEEVGEFLSEGEKLWRENNLMGALTKFRQGYEYMQENMCLLDKNKDKALYSFIELMGHDMKSLSQMVLFDRDFQNIFQVNDFTELKTRMSYLIDFMEKNITEDVAHHPLQSVLSVKMTYIGILANAVFSNIFDDATNKSRLRKYSIPFKELHFKKAEKSLKAIDVFLAAFKEKARKYGEYKFMPIHVKAQLIRLLQQAAIKEEKPELPADKIESTEQGFKLEKAEYEIWDIKGKKPAFKKAVEDLRNKKTKLDIFVDEDGTAYFKGKKVTELEKPQILYDFLIYFLKNKGIGGTYENLFLEVWPIGKEKKSRGQFEITESQKGNVIRMKNRLNALLKNYGVKEIKYEYNKYRLNENCDFCLIQRNTG